CSEALRVGRRTARVDGPDGGRSFQRFEQHFARVYLHGLSSKNHCMPVLLFYTFKLNTTTLANKGYNHVLDADIKDYFGSIDQEMLMRLVRRRVADRRVLKLLWGWLKAGVMEDGRTMETITGTPQGGGISPL